MSSKKLLMKAAAISLDDEEGNDAGTSTPARPRTAPGQLMGLQAQHADALATIDELKQQIKSGPLRMLPLDDLVEVPGRRRKLTETEFVELRNNLAQHPLVTPITVRDAGAGRFEIVSGHNRVAAYRDLGRSEIAAWVTDTPADAEEIAFYANLLHPSLPDFEKFLGLEKIVAAAGGYLTDAELSKRTGISETVVWQLRQFEALPAEALEMLAARPEKLGYNTATKLAALAANGKADKVIEAIRLLVTEPDMDQKAALAMASAQDVQASKKQSLRIRQGNRTFCTVQSSSKAIKLTFENEDDRAEIESLVADLVKKQAARKK